MIVLRKGERAMGIEIRKWVLSFLGACTLLVGVTPSPTIHGVCRYGYEYDGLFNAAANFIFLSCSKQ